MKNKRVVFLSVLVLILITLGCAHQKSLVSTSGYTEKKASNPRAVRKFVDGVILDLQDNYAAALLAYQEALLYDSNSAEICVAIARDYLYLGREESGKKFLEKTLKFDPENLDALELMVKIYLRSRQINIAEEYLKKIVSIDSTNVESYRNLALIYLQKGESRKAADVYNRVLQINNLELPDIQLSLGDLYLELRQYDDAADIFQKYNKIYPYDGHGYFGLGLTYEALKDTVNAVKNYLKALEISPALNQVSMRLSVLYQEIGEWDKAVQLFLIRTENDSTDIDAWLGLGDLYRQKKDTIKALQSYRKTKELFPDDIRSRIAVGRLQLDGNNPEAALREFNEIKDKFSQNPAGWIWSGITLVQLDSLNAAAPRLEKALDLSPQDPLGNYYLGILYMQKDRPAEAIPFLETALYFNPQWISVLTILANAHEIIKQYAVADSLYNKILKQDPDNDLVLNNYGYSLTIRGIQFKKAKKMVKRALEINPENGSYLDTMGWLLYKMGEDREALDFIIRAFSANNKSAEIADHLGDVYNSLGMKEKAEYSWKKALELEPDNKKIKDKLNSVLE